MENALEIDIVVIGGGQGGLSAAYHLRRHGLVPNVGYTILDQTPRPGGAWQFRWPSLTLSTVNRVHDLPGMKFSDVLAETGSGEIQIQNALNEVRASEAVPKYFAEYEKKFELPVHRPYKVNVVCPRGDRFIVESDLTPLTDNIFTTGNPFSHDNPFSSNNGNTRGVNFQRISTRAIINATGTWESPYIPKYPGADRFKGQQLHTKDYKSADEFIGKHVIIVGAGISAIQLLDEISKVTKTTWVTRRKPEFREGPFNEEAGRAAVAIVEDRVRRGLPPNSVVSVTGIPVTPAILAARKRGALTRHPMFSEITEDGVSWPDGTSTTADVILWCTGFRSSLDHLAPLQIREPNGGIIMTGRLATQVAKEPRLHLIGYGPSASTIGANRAGRAAVDELIAYM